MAEKPQSQCRVSAIAVWQKHYAEANEMKGLQKDRNMSTANIVTFDFPAATKILGGKKDCGWPTWITLPPVAFLQLSRIKLEQASPECHRKYASGILRHLGYDRKHADWYSCYNVSTTNAHEEYSLSKSNSAAPVCSLLLQPKQIRGPATP